MLCDYVYNCIQNQEIDLHIRVSIIYVFCNYCYWTCIKHTTTQMFLLFIELHVNDQELLPDVSKISKPAWHQPIKKVISSECASNMKLHKAIKQWWQSNKKFICSWLFRTLSMSKHKIKYTGHHLREALDY